MSVVEFQSGSSGVLVGVLGVGWECPGVPMTFLQLLQDIKKASPETAPKPPTDVIDS